MKFAILGAGGIGCYYAARLLNAGHDVVLVARSAHLEALKTQGLSLTHPDFSFAGKVNATDIAGLCEHSNAADFDLLILASKGSTTRRFLNRCKAGSHPARCQCYRFKMVSLTNK